MVNGNSTANIHPSGKRLQFQGHIISSHTAPSSRISPLPPLRLCKAINYRPFRGSSSRPPQWSRWKAVCSFCSKPRETCLANQSQLNFCVHWSSMWREERREREREKKKHVSIQSRGTQDICGVAALGFFLVEATWTWRTDCRKGWGSAKTYMRCDALTKKKKKKERDT